ncbi:lipase family protein [Salinisphaera sp.]|uniref:lipase family protein n=1 Tax=Salinisphaera sp. TaxID=1914330 RepID=UPI002D78EA57|nr:lipase family protein [Salinisphaera sp.]HET7314486.1 lipase family protein [Salinisphaera sp.]
MTHRGRFRPRRALAAVGLALLAGCVQAPLPGPIRPAPGAPPAGAIAYPAPGPPFLATADDPFYRQPGATRLAAMAPGTIIRYRPIVPRAYRVSHVQAHAWQFVYRSTDTQGAPVADVATLVVPPRARRRLLSYQVAYDALNPVCAPSQEIVRGTLIEQWFVSKALRRGWPVLLPDYEGPKQAFGAGRNAGYAVLDAIRAARAFAPARLIDAEAPVALWGYSGGAFASLWAGELAANYAPGLPIVGIAAGGPPANPLATARHIDGGVFAGIYFEAALGLARAYPGLELDRLLNGHGRAMRRKLAHSCLGQELAWVRDPLLSGYSFAEMKHYVTVDDLLSLPAVATVARANRLGGHGLPAPLFYYAGWFDQLTPRDQARALARRYCDAGVAVDFDWIVGEHLSSALIGAGGALDFLSRRFARRRTPDDCPSIENKWPARAASG